MKWFLLLLAGCSGAVIPKLDAKQACRDFIDAAVEKARVCNVTIKPDPLQLMNSRCDSILLGQEDGYLECSDNLAKQTCREFIATPPITTCPAFGQTLHQ